MSEPVILDIPYKQSRAEVRERLDKGIGKLASVFPGGAVVDHRWEGDIMLFTVQALGQKVSSKLELFDTYVRTTIDLPPFLALFADKIRAKLAREAPKLLE